jgi:GNAT superfamily N-acetyltransferase
MNAPHGSSAPLESSRQVRLVARPVDHRDSTTLLQAFYQDQIERYGFADAVDLDSADYAPPCGVFVVLYEDDQPIGCGGCRWYDRDAAVAEIKKVYVLPSTRGHGGGRLLLQWLEAQAAGWGAKTAVLETGVRNTAALSLFARCGYRPTSRYVPGRDPEINLAFVKELVPSSSSAGVNSGQAAIG